MLYQEMQIKIALQYITSNSFDLRWVLKGSFNKYDGNFDHASEIITPALQHQNICLWGHQKILSRGSNYTVTADMWSKCSNSTISMTEVIITSLLFIFHNYAVHNYRFFKGLTRKNNFWGVQVQ